MVTEYSLGEAVLCSQGILIYEAKIQDIKNENGDTLYGIHYKGWNKSWDEYVPASRLLKITEENLKKQKQLQEELKQSKKKTNSSSNSSVASLFKKAPKKAGSESDSSSREGSKDKDVSSTTSTKNVAVRLERLKKDSESGDYNVNKDEKAEDKPVIKSKTRTIKPVIAFKATEVPKSMKKKKKDEKNETQTNNKNSKSDKSGDLNKRKRDFGQEIKVYLPDVLKTVLVDDFDFMDRQRKLVNLPARYSVDDMLSDYSDFCSSQRKQNLARQEVCRGLRDYFNCTLGSQLLYKFERVQYADVLKVHPGQPMSQLYSPVHLLRLLTRLGPMLTSVDMKEEDVNGLLENISHLVTYMETKSEEIFVLGDYGTATPEYHRRAL